MTPRRFRDIRDAFDAVVQRGGSDREAILEQIRQRDVSLYQEVCRLVAARDNIDGFLERTVTLKGHCEQRRRFPNWLKISIAASFVLYTAVAFYADIRGPELTGIRRQLRPNEIIVETVYPNTPAERAGLRAGERIVSWNGSADFTGLWWHITRSNLKIDNPYGVGVATASGLTRQVTLEYRAKTLHEWWRERAGWWSIAGVLRPWLCLTLAILIAFRCSSQGAGLWAALLLAEAAISFLPSPDGLAAIFRGLPLPISILALAVKASGPLAVGAMPTFCVNFPRPLQLPRGAWLLIWSGVAYLLVLTTVEQYATVYFPHFVTRLPASLFDQLSVAFIASAIVGLLLLANNYRWLRDPGERRRVRLVTSGFAFAVLAVIPGFLSAAATAPIREAARLLVSWRVSAVLDVMSLLMPVLFAYALLRHRLFDVHVIVRQSLRYAAARGVLISAVPLLAALLVLDVLRQSDRPSQAVLVERSSLYVTLAVCAAAAHWKQRTWLEALDRRFFRERYDANRLLRRVAEEVRRAASFPEAAQSTVAHIEAAVHPAFASVLIRGPDEPFFHEIASAPVPSALRIRADSKVVGIIRVLGKPLEIRLSNNRALARQLPAGEANELRETGLEYIVPVSQHPASTEALIALGQKRSEEPFTEEDESLLVGIASSLALTADRVDPKVIAHRYAVERLLGEGGMGVVYAGTDAVLRRAVAIKVTKSGLLPDSEAAERFHSEARIAASIAHPHVVTIYDFGIMADGIPYLIMELLDGVNLRSHLTSHGRLCEREALDIVRQVGTAINAAHSRNVLHRDLKPENIFLVRSEEGVCAKVLDFGIARALEAGTISSTVTSGVVIGTPAYMAPEQIRGGSPTRAWDIWALAVVTFEMLTGAHPFAPSPAESPHGTTAFEASRKQMAPGWNAFFSKAFDEETCKRPQTVREFLALLDSITAGSSTDASRS